jgi:TonB family protein
LRGCGRRSAWTGGASGLAAVLLALLASAAIPPLGAVAAAPPAGASVRAATLIRARQLLTERKFQAAAEVFAQANELAGGHCGECLLGLARAKQGLGDLNAGIVAAQKAVEALAKDPLQGLAYQHLGDLLSQRAGACEPPPCDAAALADLAAAEETYGSALASGSADRSYSLAGLALTRIRLAHYPEAADAARQSLTAAATGAAAARARVLLCRARWTGKVPAADGPEAAIRVDGRVSKPVKVSVPAPSFSESARKKRTEGTVIIEAIIDREGCVTDTQVLQGAPEGLDAAALQAVRHWVFEPAKRDGKPVKVFYTLTVNFKVDRSQPPWWESLFWSRP